MIHSAIHPQVRQQLQAAWQGVRDTGQPELLVLEGAAGLGKTHLMAALRREVTHDPAVRVVVAAPGQVIGSLLRGLPGLLGQRDAAFVAAARSHVPEQTWPPVVCRDMGADGPGVLVRAAAQQVTAAHPLLLIVEDWHEQGAQDRSFVDMLWTRLLLDARPALLLVTTRPRRDYPEAAEGIEALSRTALLTRGREVGFGELSALTSQGVQELVFAHLDHHPPPELVEWLCAHAEGHPLRSVELLHVLRDRGALVHHAHHWHFQVPPVGSLPPSLNAVLQARLQAVRLQRSPWKALTALAVLEVPTPERIWRQVAELNAEVLSSARDWLLHRDLVRFYPGLTPAGEAQYQCAHPLYPPMLRAELDWNELETLHARAASSGLDVLLRARHARHAAHPDAQALTLDAMRLAQSRAAHQDVIREARAVLDEQPGHPEAREALLQALSLSGQAETVIAETDTDPTQRPMPELTARVLALAELGRHDEVLTLARAGLSRPGTLAEEHVLLEHTLHFSMMYLGHLDELEEKLNCALQEHPSSTRTAQLLDSLSRLYNRRGDYHLSLFMARESMKAIGNDQSGIQRMRSLNTLGGTAIHLSLWDEAEQHLRSAHVMATEQGALTALMVIGANLAYLHLMQGHYPSAEEGTWVQYHRAVALKNKRVQAGLLWNLGICRLWRGDLTQALEFMESSLEQWPSVGGAGPTDIAEALALQGQLALAREQLGVPDHDFYPEHPNSRARVYLLLGEPQEALREAARIHPEDGAGLLARSSLVQAQAHLQMNALEAAQEQLGQALNYAQVAQHRSVQGEVLLTQAVLACRQQGETGHDGGGPQFWREGLNLLAQTDGQGHLKFVELLFPAEVERLSSRAARSPTPVPRARLRLLGNVQVAYPDGLRPWRARKVKELLGLLVCAYYSGGRQGISRERLIFDLWPDADEQSAESSFRKTVTRLREALADCATLTRTSEGEYRLQDVNADLDEFLNALDRGRDADAVVAYTAPFLNDLDLTAAQELREHLHEHYRAALLRLAQADPQAAQPHLQLLLSQDALDLEVTTTLLHVHVALGHKEAHRNLLRRARTLYQTTLGEVPPELVQAAGA